MPQEKERERDGVGGLVGGGWVLLLPTVLSSQDTTIDSNFSSQDTTIGLNFVGFAESIILDQIKERERERRKRTMSMSLLSLIVLLTSAVHGHSNRSNVYDPFDAHVWPPPKSSELKGDPIFFSKDWNVDVIVSNSDILNKAIKRFRSSISLMTRGREPDVETRLEVVRIRIENDDETLNGRTNASYSLTVVDGTALLTSETIYGALYGMETILQLVDEEKGHFMFSNVKIQDSPSYQWRGLMIDSGRRFVPLDTLKNILDTMSAVKLNVLHLHASDHCRFGIESKTYPNLTDALTGIHGGFYTQEDVHDLVSYAKDRGVRVVPEFDVPGHSRGWMPIESKDGLEFCEPDAPSRSQLHGTNGTFAVVYEVLKEMASLFPDNVFNIGSDETAAKGDCTVNSTFAFERRVLNAIASDFGKVPMGWEEVLFDAGAATNETIVDAWSRHPASDITATGRRAVESKSSAFYFTEAVPGGPDGWAKVWYDISTGVPDTQRQLLLGGEMSMWTDTYCYICQCGSATTCPKPVGSKLFSPERDVEFARSIGGMIWPRGYVGAAAFWNYNASLDPTSAFFVDGVYRLNDRLEKRGSLVCKSNCTCDQLTQCGEPYIAGESDSGKGASAQEWEI